MSPDPNGLGLRMRLGAHIWFDKMRLMMEVRMCDNLIINLFTWALFLIVKVLAYAYQGI